MDVAADGFDETGHVDEFPFGGGGNPKVDSFSMSWAVGRLVTSELGRHEASSDDSL